MRYNSRLTIRIPSATAAMLKRLAKLKGMTIPELARKIINRGLEEATRED